MHLYCWWTRQGSGSAVIAHTVCIPKNNPRQQEAETRDGKPVWRSTQINMNINKRLGIYGAVQGAAWSWNNICQMSSLVSWPVLLLSLTAGNGAILWLAIQTWLLHCCKGIWHIWEPCWKTSGQMESAVKDSLIWFCFGCLLWFIHTVGNIIHRQHVDSQYAC